MISSRRRGAPAWSRNDGDFRPGRDRGHRGEPLRTTSPESQLALGAAAFRAALEDAGLDRREVDGLAVNLGWPLGLDYDRIAEAFGLDVRYVNQTWTHGRFVTMALQQAALAVAAGLAEVVACIAVASFTRERDLLGGPGDFEGMREEGGTHAENPPYGLTARPRGAALAYRRYMSLYGATTDALGEVAVTLRSHALRNPNAVMRKPMTRDDHRASREVVAPLRLFDCCIVSDGAVVVLVTSAERARDLRKPPVFLSGMQGIRAGRDEFIFAPPGLGINQQRPGRVTHAPKTATPCAWPASNGGDVDGLYTYDAFTPLVLFVLERFGFCAPGGGARMGAGRAHRARRRAPRQYLRRAHVGGARQRLELDRRDRATVAGRGGGAADRRRTAPPVGDGVGRLDRLPPLRGAGPEERGRDGEAEAPGDPRTTAPSGRGAASTC